MTEESKASRWLAMGFEERDELTLFTITYKSFYEANGYLYDQDLSELIESDIPDFDLISVTETEYEFLGSPEEAKAYVRSIGMIVLDDES